MQNIYCIPGLGADDGVFQYLDLSFVQPVFLRWIEPLKNETLHAYAMRMKEKYIHEENPLIFGLSLGGMIATEIAKAIPSAKTIIISSAKSKSEIPFYWKAFRYLPLHKTLPDWSIRQHTFMREFLLGAKKRKTINYVKDVAQHADADFYRWAVDAILNWDNKIIPSNVVHLHGTNDKLLPYKFISADITVNNGGHLMIIENASEISVLIKNIILN